MDLEQPETELSTVAQDEETIPDTAHQSAAEVEIVETEWDITPVGHYITYPSPCDGGYVALLDGHVATSADALSWEVMETQPFATDPQPESQRMLAVTPDGLIAVSRISGALIFRNGRWEAITIEGLPAAPIIEDGYTVDIGLIDNTAALTIGHDAYWLFDGEMFRSAPEIAEMTWSNVWNRVAYLTEIPPPRRSPQTVSSTAPHSGPGAWSPLAGPKTTRPRGRASTKGRSGRRYPCCALTGTPSDVVLRNHSSRPRSSGSVRSVGSPPEAGAHPLSGGTAPTASPGNSSRTSPTWPDGTSWCPSHLRSSSRTIASSSTDVLRYRS